MDPRIWLLAFGNFAAGTGALIVTGLLDAIADDLGVSVSLAGQLTTVFAITVAIAGPVLATLTQRVDRRTLLVTALSIHAAGTLGAALAGDFATLCVTRVLTALGMSIYTPHAASTGALIAGPLLRGRAIAVVFAGWVFATAIGVPIGNAISALGGWRVAFAVTALLPAVAAVALYRLLPAGLHVPPADASAWGQLLRSRALMLMVSTTAVQLGGQLTVFVYLAPLLRSALGLGPLGIGALFMVYGFANGLGMVVVARSIDRVGAARLTNAALIGTVLSMAVLPLVQTMLWPSIAVVVFWGLGSFAINAGTQARLVSAAPWLATASLPLNSSAISIGQALGAVVGGWVILHDGYARLSWAGGLIVLLALGLSIAAGRQPMPRQHPRPAGTG